MFQHATTVSNNQQGDEKTFGTNYAFTEHLRQLVAQELPKVDVRVLVYPTYDTRGDLVECVNRFRDWYGVLPQSLPPYRLPMYFCS